MVMINHQELFCSARNKTPLQESDRIHGKTAWTVGPEEGKKTMYLFWGPWSKWVTEKEFRENREALRQYNITHPSGPSWSRQRKPKQVSSGISVAG